MIEQNRHEPNVIYQGGATSVNHLNAVKRISWAAAPPAS